MGGTSEMLVSWWSCCWVVCVWDGLSLSWALGSPGELISPRSLRAPCASVTETGWSPSDSGDLKPAVVCRDWQSCGFKSDTTMLCATSSALFLTGAEAHHRQTTLHVFLRSLLESVGESRAAQAKWGLTLYVAELCGNGRDHHGEGWAVARHCSLAAFRAFCWTWSLAQRLSPSSPARQQFGPLCLPPPASFWPLQLHMFPSSSSWRECILKSSDYYWGQGFLIILTSYLRCFTGVTSFQRACPPFLALHGPFSDLRNAVAVCTEFPGHHCFSSLFKLFKVV